MKRLSTIFFMIGCALRVAYAAETQPLPSPTEFDPSKYLGRWFEVARIPTPVQPGDSLATAEYSAGAEDGWINVKNTAFDPNGKVIQEVTGKARRVEGEPKGRLRVSFGPVLPSEPNYCVLRVNKNYTIALVGSPDRNSLWILARKVPVRRARLDRLAKFAESAGYDISKLVFAKWPDTFSANGEAGATGAESNIAGHWTIQLAGPNGETVSLPMELRVNGKDLTGRVGRTDGRWMELKDGQMDGGAFHFQLERDRPGGGTMTYKLTGKHADEKLSGEATTNLNGQDVTSAWEAVRVKEGSN